MIALLTVTCLIALGLLGTLLPILPGTVLAFGGIVLHKAWVGEASVPWSFVLFALLLTVLTLLVDAWGSWWGARRFGASWKGAMGAVLGGLGGLVFFGLPGLLMGPILGAILFELLDCRSAPEATRAGLGTLLGAVLAFFIKLGLTVAMVAGFYLSLPWTGTPIH